MNYGKRLNKGGSLQADLEAAERVYYLYIFTGQRVNRQKKNERYLGINE